MFDNIGAQIKEAAKLVCYLGILLSVWSGISGIVNNWSHSWILAIAGGVLTVAAGSLLSWIGSLLVYGFGQLVENSDK